MAKLRGLAPGSRAHQAISLLEENGPMTAAEVAAELCVSPSEASAVLTRNKPHRCHVKTFRRVDEDGALMQRAVYAAGPGADAKRLRPLTKLEVDRRYREHKKRRVNSVFTLGVPIKKRSAKTGAQRSAA